MKLVICSFDYTGRNVKKLAEEIGTWESVEVLSCENPEELHLDASNEIEYVIASDCPDVRERAFQRLKEEKVRIATLIHPENYISEGTKIGEGCIFHRGVIVYYDSCIGENTVMKEYASFSHDSQIGKHCVLMEKCTTGEYSHFGDKICFYPGVVAKDELTVGDGVCAQPASAIMKDVEANQVVMGNPARITKR